MTTVTNATPALKRREIRTVLRRHKGSVTQLARELDVTHPSVSKWLSGKATSAKIADGAQRMAAKLLQAERESPTQ